MTSQIKDRKFRICLVNPKLEGPYPPLGIGYLASYLSKYGQYSYEFKIVDGNCCRNILDEVIKFNPDLVGFTSLSPQIKDAIDLSCRLRSLRRDVRQFIGGMHVSALPEETLSKGNFDLGVLGEGEQTFLELSDLLAGGRFCAEAVKKINGVCFKENGIFFKTAPREEIAELDSIPPPARGLLNMKHYLSCNLLVRGLIGSQVTTVMGSRGCPFDCTFCSSKIVFKHPRQFSARYVVEEVKNLVKEYNIKAVFFTDDTFTINQQRIREFCNLLIEEGLSRQIKWDVQGRADMIKPDMLALLKLMKEAGCVQIDYGFESGSQRILNFLKKSQVSLGDNKRAIRITKEAGLQVMGTFILGVPGETDKELEQTKNFILQNLGSIDYFQTFIATPYPGTELYRICIEKNIVRRDYLEQVAQEEANPNKFICYTDTIAHDKIKEALKYLNKIAATKINAKAKIKWLVSNLIKKPSKVIEVLKYYF